MTSGVRLITLPAVALVLAIAGCNHAAGRPTRAQATGSPPQSRPASAGAAARATDPRLAAVAVARAFTTEICPYSYHDQLPYGQRVDAALRQWGTAELADVHWWGPARTASAAAGLVRNRAEQACGAMTGGLDPEATKPAGSVAVRLSVTVTTHGQSSATSTAQEVFRYLLVHRGPRWLISFAQW